MMLEVATSFLRRACSRMTWPPAPAREARLRFEITLDDVTSRNRN
jgi:hypothetical protein